MTVWSRIAASVVRLPPPQTTAVSVERGLAAKMPDGVELLADRWYPTDPSGGLATVLIRTPYGRSVMGPLGRLYAERGYQVVVQSCRGTFGSGGRVRPGAQRAGRRAGDARVGGGPALVRRPARHVGRELPRPDAVGRGGGRAGLRPGAQLPGHGVELPRLRRLPGRGVRARDGAGLAVPDQEPGAAGGAPCCAPICGAPGWSRRRATSCPSGSATAPPSASPCPSIRTGSRTAPPVTRGGTASTSAAGWSKVPPASFIGGWYDLFLRAQVADYEALRRAGRTARLTIGPWTHASPALFAETVRDGPRWFDAQLGAAARACRARTGARLRHGVAHLAGVLAVATGGGDRAVVSRALGRTLSPTPPVESAPDRYHYNPHDPTPAVGGPSLNMRHGGPQGAASARAPPRRPHLHQPRPHRGPHRHRPADGHALRCARRSSTPTSSCACATCRRRASRST